MKITIKDLKKAYSGKLVLNINKLEIEEGKITGIIGPNGSGKSTLLNIIAGLDGEFSGEIKYNDKTLNREIFKKMTLVMQKPYLFKRKVFENIEYPLKVRNIKKEDRKKETLDILKSLEIEELKDKKAHLLSGGESQKVSLARALIINPELLLLDEPTSNIDPESIKIMEREIIRFNEETKSTVLIVTHNMAQSERICHKVLYLDKGKVGFKNGFF